MLRPCIGMREGRWVLELMGLIIMIEIVVFREDCKRVRRWMRGNVRTDRAI